MFEEPRLKLGINLTVYFLNCCPQITLNIFLQTLRIANNCWVIKDKLDDFHLNFF